MSFKDIGVGAGVGAGIGGLLGAILSRRGNRLRNTGRAALVGAGLGGLHGAIFPSRMRSARDILTEHAYGGDEDAFQERLDNARKFRASLPNHLQKGYLHGLDDEVLERKFLVNNLNRDEGVLSRLLTTPIRDRIALIGNHMHRRMEDQVGSTPGLLGYFAPMSRRVINYGEVGPDGAPLPKDSIDATIAHELRHGLQMGLPSHMHEHGVILEGNTGFISDSNSWGGDRESFVPYSDVMSGLDNFPLDAYRGDGGNQGFLNYLNLPFETEVRVADMMNYGLNTGKLKEGFTPQQFLDFVNSLDSDNLDSNVLPHIRGHSPRQTQEILDMMKDQQGGSDYDFHHEGIRFTPQLFKEQINNMLNLAPGYVSADTIDPGIAKMGAEAAIRELEEDTLEDYAESDNLYDPYEPEPLNLTDEDYALLELLMEEQDRDMLATVAPKFSGSLGALLGTMALPLGLPGILGGWGLGKAYVNQSIAEQHELGYKDIDEHTKRIIAVRDKLDEEPEALQSKGKSLGRILGSAAGGALTGTLLGLPLGLAADSLMGANARNYIIRTLALAGGALPLIYNIGKEGGKRRQLEEANALLQSLTDDEIEQLVRERAGYYE